MTMARRKPIRRQSARAAAQARERRAIKVKLAGHTGRTTCTFPGGCHREAVDVDEQVNRSQLTGAAVNEDLMQPLCRTHHDWKHQHPNEAEALGVYVRGSTYRRGQQP